MDQPGKVANPARGQLNRENNIPLSPCVPENLVSRDGFISRPVPRQPAHLHTQAESGAYLRDSSRVPRRRPFMKPPYATGSVPSLSGHAIKKCREEGHRYTAHLHYFCYLLFTYVLLFKEQPIIMRIEDRLFDRGWVRSAMATRKCGNIYFRKYFVAVRKFTNIFVLLLILMVGSRDTLFLVCFT